MAGVVSVPPQEQGEQPAPDQPAAPGQLADVAGEVEGIVIAAQQAAEQLRAETVAELDRLRDQAERNAAAIEERARVSTSDELAQARGQSDEIVREGRREAEQIVAQATAAADQALTDARALSAGLTRLGKLLEEQAARMLSDVRGGHKRLLADLRAQAGTAPPAPKAEEGESAGRRPRGRRPRVESSLADVDPPEWVSP